MDVYINGVTSHQSYHLPYSTQPTISNLLFLLFSSSSSSYYYYCFIFLFLFLFLLSTSVIIINDYHQKEIMQRAILTEWSAHTLHSTISAQHLPNLRFRSANSPLRTYVHVPSLSALSSLPHPSVVNQKKVMYS